MSASLSIGEVSERTGVPASTLRYYDRRGILPQPERVKGRRRYGEEVVQRVALIQLAQQAGFTLEEIYELFGDFSDPIRTAGRWRAMARHKLDEIESSIDRLQNMKALLEEGLRCTCLTLKDCAIFTRHMASSRTVTQTTARAAHRSVGRSRRSTVRS